MSQSTFLLPDMHFLRGVGRPYLQHPYRLLCMLVFFPHTPLWSLFHPISPGFAYMAPCHASLACRHFFFLKSPSQVFLSSVFPSFSPSSFSACAGDYLLVPGSFYTPLYILSYLAGAGSLRMALLRENSRYDYSSPWTCACVELGRRKRKPSYTGKLSPRK